MNHRPIAAAFFLALAVPLAASAQASCPKPFSARLHSGGEVVDAACDGPLMRVGMGKGTTMIHDMKANRTTLVLDASREYAEYVPSKEEQAEEERLAFEPCTDQKKLAREYKGISCRKTGSATVAGRSTERWETRGGGVEPITEFFDPELKLVLKEQQGDRVAFELIEVKVGAPAPSLFRVPAGYRKISVDQYYERAIKAAQDEEKRGRKK